jgi:hypothetical protein
MHVYATYGSNDISSRDITARPRLSNAGHVLYVQHEFATKYTTGCGL